MKKYFQFQGRSRRSEYWYLYLILIVGNIATRLLDEVTGLNGGQGPGPFNALFTLAHLIPTISAGVRRMHDSNHSGWWLLVPFYNLYLLVKNGDVGANRFGEDPKATGADVAQPFS
jgi:uncharacterized membrane protein YhaH (DUF805 family)